MKNILENPIVEKAKCACKSLADIRVKQDYNMTVSLYDSKDPEAVECTHTVKGSCDHSLVKMIAVAGVVAVALSAICGVCSLFRKR